MRAVYKPDEITSLPFEEVRKIVVAGLGSLIGKQPEQRQTALVMAKITLECGRRGMELLTSCHQGNVGNIKAGPDYEGMFTLYGCNEVLDDHVVWFSPEGRLSGKGGTVVTERHALPPDGDGHPQCRFRAYANAVDGIYEYLDFIWTERYRSAREALLTGDPLAYVHALKLKGYFTADESVYGRSVASLHAEFMARIQGRAAPEMPVPDLTGLRTAEPFNAREVKALAEAAFASRQYQIAAERPDFEPSDDEPTVVLPKAQV